MFIIKCNSLSDSQKEGLRNFLESMLVRQAIGQHRAVCDKWERGIYCNHSYDIEKECLIVSYENGEKWKYQCIDLGVEGMISTRIS